MRFFLPEKMASTQYPSVMHAWDNTPRSGINGLVFKNSTPEKFAIALQKAFDLTRAHEGEKRFVFLKSWNEWAEGNHLEPDLRDGLDYLVALKRKLDQQK